MSAAVHPPVFSLHFFESANASVDFFNVATLSEAVAELLILVPTAYLVVTYS